VCLQYYKHCVLCLCNNTVCVGLIRGQYNITTVTMDSNCTETVENQSDHQSASDPAEYNDQEGSCSTVGAVTDNTNKYSVPTVSDSVEIIEQHVTVDSTLEVQSGVERPSDISTGTEKPAGQSQIDNHEKITDSTTDFQDSRLIDYNVNTTEEASQSQSSVQGHWQPSNPFLGVTSSNSLATGDSVTPKSGSSSSFVHTLTPMDVSDGVADSSPLSTSAPSDMAMGYSKLRESTHSSLCSASPYDSPTHAASAGGATDPTTEAAGGRPDSLYLSRSILQERERQWLAKKGSYSSLSECDSSPGGSMDALIEVATSTPLHAQGTVSMEGDMITFVADGINELIKRSRGGNCVYFVCKCVLLVCYHLQ